MKYYSIVVFTFLFSLTLSWGCCQNTSGVSVSTYLPWQNKLGSLVDINLKDQIPILYEGKNYRVVEVHNGKKFDITLHQIKNTFDKVAIKCSYLPVIKNYRGEDILDVLLPNYKGVKIKKGTSAFFLIEMVGNVQGEEREKIEFDFSNDVSISLSISVLVGKLRFQHALDVNVWCYFNYDLIKGLKNDVIDDLNNHGVNVLVIPPYRLPNIRKTTFQNESELTNYLSGTQNRFDHYLLFLNYRTYNNSSFILSRQWQLNFKKWLIAVKASFEKSGIDFNKVMLYPYDEPNSIECSKLVALKEWCRRNNIHIPFYSTIGNNSAMKLESTVQTLQINTKVKVPVTFKKGSNVNIWEYEIKAQSRNVPALHYLNFGWRAFRDDATGIGIWNYADVKKSYSNESLRDFAALKSTKGSWEVRQTDVSRDYSCVYRRGNELYSSIRWEAVSMTQQDYNFLLFYQKLNGKEKAVQLARDLVTGKISLQNWEKQKTSLLKIAK